MAKTLIINGADYSANAVDTVSFGGDIPCEGITLDKNTLNIALGNTGTIVATPVPAETTDTVLWSSSDESVVTVDGGIVSPVGIGSATITAQCGSYSATCSVVVSSVMNGTNVPGVNLAGATTYSGNVGLGYIETNTRAGAMMSSSGTLEIQNKVDQTAYYPYKMPDNTKRVKITNMSSSFSVSRVQFYSCTVASSSYPSNAQLVDHITSLTFENNVCIVDVPEHTGFPTIDGIAIRCYGASGYQFKQSDFDSVTVEFLPAE